MLLAQVLRQFRQQDPECERHHGSLPPAGVHLGIELEVEVGPVEVPKGLGLDLRHGELAELHQQSQAGEPNLKYSRDEQTVA